MNKQKTHIDDMLRQLDNHQLRGTADAKAAFMKKAGRHSFLKFYPGRFNLYYLITGIILITGTTFLIISQSGSATPQYQKEINIETLKNNYSFVETEADTETHQISLPEENSEIENIQAMEIVPIPTQSIENETKTEKTKQTSQIINDSEKSKKQALKKEVIEKPIIYDTIQVEKHVTIQDTIHTKITDTIKVKGKQKRRRR